MKFSVIIPALNEQRWIRKCIRSVRLSDRDVEVIVVDGGSRDRTVRIAEEEKAVVHSASGGRGIQLRKGAEFATGEILLFLHADTVLPPHAFETIQEKFRNDMVRIATFRMRFDHHHPVLRVYSFFTRFDSILTTFGDQAIIIRRPFYDKIGGFPPWPLFEDVWLFQKARKSSGIYVLPTSVTTSARRFREGGIIRQQLYSAWLMVLFLLGVSPWALARMYYGESK